MAHRFEDLSGGAARLGGHDQDRATGALPDPFGGLHPIEVGHHQIQQHQIGLIGGETGHGIEPVAGDPGHAVRSIVFDHPADRGDRQG